VITETDVLIVGAGLSGLVAARALTGAGAAVALVDKGVGPGGRLATRRVGDAVLDHGAQFFTIRDAAFRSLVDDWTAEGLPVRVWTRGFARAGHVEDGPAAADPGGDGHPRHAVAGGMNRIAKHLADGLDVTDQRRLTEVRRTDAGWEASAGDRTWRSARLLLTPPVPQSLALLDAGGVALDEGTAAAARRIAYDPALALLVPLDAPPTIPGGGVQIAGGPVSWLGDNAHKGTSSVPALTVHAAAAWSRDHLTDDEAEVTAALLEHVAPWLGAARPVATQLKRWRYSAPSTGHDDRCLATTVGGAPLVLAGDAFGAAKVEGAALSGLAAARALGA
jgi:renalase